MDKFFRFHDLPDYKTKEDADGFKRNKKFFENPRREYCMHYSDICQANLEKQGENPGEFRKKRGVTLTFSGNWPIIPVICRIRMCVMMRGRERGPFAHAQSGLQHHPSRRVATALFREFRCLPPRRTYPIFRTENNIVK